MQFRMTYILNLVYWSKKSWNSVTHRTEKIHISLNIWPKNVWSTAKNCLIFRLSLNMSHSALLIKNVKWMLYCHFKGTFWNKQGQQLYCLRHTLPYLYPNRNIDKILVIFIREKKAKTTFKTLNSIPSVHYVNPQTSQSSTIVALFRTYSYCLVRVT